MDYPSFSDLGTASLKILKLNGIFKAGKSTSIPKYVQNQCSLKVEIVKSIDDVVTSQSIAGRRDFSDYEMLRAKIASALKKIITSVHFRRRVSVEGQRAQKYDRFLRGKQIAYIGKDSQSSLH